MRVTFSQTFVRGKLCPSPRGAFFNMEQQFHKHTGVRRLSQPYSFVCLRTATRRQSARSLLESHLDVYMLLSDQRFALPRQSVSTPTRWSTGLAGPDEL
ncbi:hypothetical protein ZHAS_00015026 [Anopheles sinensis]|uniref:Uncharacterized protein n=1 Tax=Anopheles sinensis TaxID=74873 RepID=A0A084W9W8_ANOSI|nr:hypothetical protein ZHAS_00015026 [Anopheles sinensis]